MTRLQVRSARGQYAIWVGRGLISEQRLRWPAWLSGRLFVIASHRVWALWGRQLARALPAAETILIDDGERAKRMVVVETLCRELVRRGADRQAVLVAVGGGVVGDLVGFVAAVYMRGVALVQVPTTLVAQIDSSIGGKTGVNLPEGKNLVGAFWPPRLVVTDPALLATLPRRQYRAGLYEVIKSAVIADRALFEQLERHTAELLAQQPSVLDAVMLRVIGIKVDVVQRDEHESGLRRILNFGHTVGHALEAALEYRTLLHGEAVGWGMLAATQLARRVVGLPPQEAERIRSLIYSLGPLPRPAVSPAEVLTKLQADKKARQGRVSWVLPRRIGEVRITDQVPSAFVRHVLASLLAAPHEQKAKPQP